MCCYAWVWLTIAEPLSVENAPIIVIVNDCGLTVFTVGFIVFTPNATLNASIKAIEYILGFPCPWVQNIRLAPDLTTRIVCNDDRPPSP